MRKRVSMSYGIVKEKEDMKVFVILRCFLQCVHNFLFR